MSTKNRGMLSYIVLLLLFGIGLWQAQAGNIAFGAGLMAAAVAVLAVTAIKQTRIRRLEAQGINVYDERVWFVAGRAAYYTYVTYALGSALVVLLGSVWGPQVLVNPYNLIGISLSILVLLYIGFYYYFNAQS